MFFDIDDDVDLSVWQKIAKRGDHHEIIVVFLWQICSAYYDSIAYDDIFNL